jgi:glucose-6-phosphate isomerase
MFVNLDEFAKLAEKKVKLVKDMLCDGKNIYKNIRGKEDEINYELFDTRLGLKRHVVSMTVLFPGKVGEEYKMTTGHSHVGVEEIYYIISGSGRMIVGDEEKEVRAGDIISIPEGAWHRAINTGNDKLIFLAIFEKYPGRG